MKQTAIEKTFLISRVLVFLKRLSVSDKKAVVRKVARIEGKIPCHDVGFSHTWKLKIIKRLIGERVSKLTVRSI